MVTGLLLGISLGIVLADGDVTAAAAIVIVGGAVLGLARLMAVPAERVTVLALILVTFALHAATVTVLHAGLVAIGRGGAITGDDGDYARIAWYVAQYLQGRPHLPYVPPDWAGEDYIVGTWVYLESAVFYIFGPQILLPKIINAGLMTAAVVVAYDIGRRLFGTRAALVSAMLIAFYPSLVLWSSLNLKDALVLFLVAVIFWMLVVFQLRPRWWALIVPFMVLLPVADLRRYIFLGLLLIVPIGVALAVPPQLRARLLWTGAAIAFSGMLLSVTRSGTGLLGPQLLSAFEISRQAMASGARTSFVDLRPLIVTDGTTFVVPAPSQTPTLAPPTGAPASAPVPTPIPAIVYVGPNTRIVVGSASPAPSHAPTSAPVALPTPAPTSVPPPIAATTPFNPPAVVYVTPGDIVVVGPPGTVPKPSPGLLAVHQGSVQLTDVETMTDRGAVAARTLDHLPVGLAYALFAPFPWDLRRSLDVLTAPEMVAWYAILSVAAWSVLRARERWQLLAPMVFFVGGTLLTLALAEGNVGTLFRHRAMVIPFVILLAGPGLSRVGQLARSAVASTALSRRSGRSAVAGAGPTGSSLQPGDHSGEA